MKPLFLKSCLLVAIFGCFCGQTRGATTGSLSSNQTTEYNLVVDLLNGYSTLVRPYTKVEGYIIFFLNQVNSIDTQNQIMTSSSLSWDPASYNGIEKVLIPAKKLWIPDLVIVNSADTNIFLTVSDSMYALVDNVGWVNMVYTAASLRTRCRMVYSISSMTVFLEDFVTVNYVENSLWDYKGFSRGQNTPLDPIQYYYPDYSIDQKMFNIVIKRKPLYFMMNSIFPCLVLNVITVLSFALPFIPQVTLGMSMFLTYSVYSINTSSSIPQQSQYLPPITCYYVLSALFTLFTFSWFILENFFRSRNHMPLPIAWYVKTLRKIEFHTKRLYQKLCKALKSLCCRCHCRCFKKKDQVEEIEKAPVVMQPLELSTPVLEKQNAVEENRQLQRRNGKITNFFVKTQPAMGVAVVGGEPFCFKCGKCAKCEEKAKKDEAKRRSKDSVDADIDYLDHHLFFVVLIALLITNITLWTYLGS